MAKLSDEEIFELYKIPNSKSVKEICKISGYFSSERSIKKTLEQGRDQGIITEQDDLAVQERLEEQKRQKKEKKSYTQNLLYEDIKSLTLQRKSCNEIFNILLQKYKDENIDFSFYKVAELRRLIIKNGDISEKDYKEIYNEIFQKARKQSGITRKKNDLERKSLNNNDLDR